MKQTLLGIATGAVLSRGSVVGGRFQVETLLTMFGQIPVYQAMDQRTSRAVALWMVPPNTLKHEVMDATRKAIRGAVAVAHKDLVVPFGSTVSPDGTLCIATEPLGETSVADLIDRKRNEGTTHSLVAAYPLVAHVTNALTIAHRSLAHGAIAPALVRIDGQGRVKLAGLGMLSALLSLDGVPAMYLAPEVRKGTTPSPQSDIYSVGALLYELLTGQHANPEVPPSQLVPGLPPTVDIIIESCLLENPEERFETAAALKGALAALVAPTERPREVESLDIDIEYDLDADPQTAEKHEPRPVSIRPGARPSGAQPVAAPQPPPPAAPPRPSPQPPPRVSQPRISQPRVSTPGGPEPSTSQPAPSTALPQGGRSGELKQLLKAVTANDADRWMFVHGGLDHGPLTARDLVQAIINGDVLAEDVVLNMESGERKKLTGWPQYREFAETAAEKRRQDQQKEDATVAIAEEGLATQGKLIIGGAVLLTLLAVGGVYYLTLGPGGRHQRSAAEIDDLVARGQLRVQTSQIQMLPPPPPSARRHGGGSLASGASYEAAMSAPIDFNFGGAGPGGGVLSDSEIMRPLNANLGRLAGCMADGSTRNVTVRIAIGGNGRAIGVTVVGGSVSVKNCVGGIIRGIPWRAFGGPRIGLSWGFGF